MVSGIEDPLQEVQGMVEVLMSGMFLWSLAINSVIGLMLGNEFYAEVVKELVYIFGGVAIAYIFVGLHAVLLRMAKGQKIFLAYGLLCLFIPAVVWQHIYEVIHQLDELKKSGETKFNIIKISYLLLFNWSILYGLIVTIFPTDQGSRYAMMSDSWAEHVKTNRRIFFLLALVYIGSAGLVNYTMNAHYQQGVEVSRYIMMIGCYVAFMTNFETTLHFLRINIRIIYPDVSFSEGFFSAQKKNHLIRIGSIRCKTIEDAARIRRSLYNLVDLITTCILVVGFLTIVAFRFGSQVFLNQ